MIDVICGLIGSGKSTYAFANYKTVIECEDGNKKKQLEKAENEHNDFAYITCWPTLVEQNYFSKQTDVRYIWINTSEAQTKENIYRRHRERDFADIRQTLQKNRELSYRAAHSDIHFIYVDVFQTGERC